MKRYVIIFLVVMIFLVNLLLVSAVDFTPQGNINLQNFYNLTNLNYLQKIKMIGNIQMKSFGVRYNITDFGYMNGSIVDATEIDVTTLDAGTIEVDVIDLGNKTKPHCSNITGAISNLCTLVDTPTVWTNVVWINQSQTFSGIQNYSNINVSGGVNASFLSGKLNWSDLQNIPTYVNNYATNAVVISADNITSGTINKARLPDLDNFSKSYCGNITGSEGNLCSNQTQKAIDEGDTRYLNVSDFNTTNITLQIWILSVNTTKNLQIILNDTGIYWVFNDSYASPFNQNKTVISCFNITGNTLCLNFTEKAILEMSQRQNGTVLNIANITGLVPGLYNVNFTINTLDEFSKRQNGTTLNWANITGIPDIVIAGSSDRVNINADNITSGTISKTRLPNLDYWIQMSCSNITDYPACSNETAAAITMGDTRYWNASLGTANSTLDKLQENQTSQLKNITLNETALAIAIGDNRYLNASLGTANTTLDRLQANQTAQIKNITQNETQITIGIGDIRYLNITTPINQTNKTYDAINTSNNIGNLLGVLLNQTNKTLQDINNASANTAYSHSQATTGTIHGLTIANVVTSVLQTNMIASIANNVLTVTMKNYFDQQLNTTNSPTFAGLTLTSFSGLVKATAGVLGNAVAGVDYIATEADPQWTNNRTGVALMNKVNTTAVNTTIIYIGNGKSNVTLSSNNTCGIINGTTTTFEIC